MTIAPAAMPDAWGGSRHRYGEWWIPDESPGGLGEDEVWIDEAAMDVYGRGDAEPSVSVRPALAGAGTWLGASIRFSGHPGLSVPVVYIVALRRRGPGLVNLGRPYYVLRRPTADS